MSSRFGLFSISPSGTFHSTFAKDTSLNNALGYTKESDHENIFIGGDGVATASNGSIFVDTNTGNAFTSVSAILEISPSVE